MNTYLIRRAARIVPLVVVISLATFTLLHLAPGGPVGIISNNPKVGEGDLERIRENFGLDKSPAVQYLLWFRQVFLHLNFGRSYVTGEPVSRMILERVPATLELMGAAFAAALLLGIGLGVLAALRRGGLIDQLFAVLTNIGVSVPVFWLGLMAIALFSLKLDLLPSGGRSVIGEPSSAAGHFKHLILPTCILSLAYLASWGRYVREALIDAIRGDFIRTARAKGLGERVVVFKHALRNAILPLLTVVAMHIPSLFTGAVITETVFSWPGMGRLFFEGLQRQDYTRVLGVVVVASFLIIISNLLGDLLCAAVDPRISLERTRHAASRGGL